MNYLTRNAQVVLASQSPRRKQLLEQIGLTPHVVKVDVPEEYNNEPAINYVRRLACDKARAGFKAYITRQSDASLPVIGADTIVVKNGVVLEKPANASDGQTMLLTLSGQSHEVMTAVAVYYNNTLECIHVTTQVTFRDISPQEALRYWHTGEPQDKAGGYGIQGLGAVFVADMTGSYSNVVGLPLFETAELLACMGIEGF